MVRFPHQMAYLCIRCKHKRMGLGVAKGKMVFYFVEAIPTRLEATACRLEAWLKQFRATRYRTQLFACGMTEVEQSCH